ncbi:acyltransferase [Anaeromicrobium sediminis]|uniref:Acetyltransferase n=1 Tax=Anaeromicrobium sediminis TaxID=1478221 RepID=A0A267MII3_9FIRM|nr:acyltransferase [Anaeromicrobium sediminis]PAB59391.1 hypothetical protein CCE28_11065 [Anaeromicrobium sediminis]
MKKSLRTYNFLRYNFPIYLINLCTSLLPNCVESNIIRGWLMRPFFKRCGKNFQIASGVTINVSRNMEIGNDVYIAHNSWINASGGLKIGDGVVISPMVVVATTKHIYINGKISPKSQTAPIVIGDFSWIASNSVITSGTTIGKGCIVGACSSVTQTVDNYWFVGGVPAKPIKKLHNNDV